MLAYQLQLSTVSFYNDLYLMQADFTDFLQFIIENYRKQRKFQYGKQNKVTSNSDFKKQINFVQKAFNAISNVAMLSLRTSVYD